MSWLGTKILASTQKMWPQTHHHNMITLVQNVLASYFGRIIASENPIDLSFKRRFPLENVKYRVEPQQTYLQFPPEKNGDILEGSVMTQD